MFNPTQADVRNFFFEVFSKMQQNIALSNLETIARGIILEHPEYHATLANRDKYLNFQYMPEMGHNPFLHLSMHLTLIEQLSINQPTGISDLFNQMHLKLKDRHTVSHEIMDCLGEMLYVAQRERTSPSVDVYFACINKKLGNV